MLEEVLKQQILKEYSTIIITSLTYEYHNDVEEYYSGEYDYWSPDLRFYKGGYYAVFIKDILLELRNLKIKRIKKIL